MREKFGKLESLKRVEKISEGDDDRLRRNGVTLWKPASPAGRKMTCSTQLEPLKHFIHLPPAPVNTPKTGIRYLYEITKRN